MSAVPACDRSRPLDRSAARAAAAWLVRLHEDATPDDHAACARWRMADPEHERAWQRALHVQAKFGAVPAGVGLPVLARDRHAGGRVAHAAHAIDRRAAVKALTALLVAAPASYLGYRETPWRAWTSGERTAVGERRSLVLADGTRVDLDTATAIDVAFDAAERRLILNAGGILVKTGPDADRPSAAHRPFVVQTPQGRIRALGTRFVVRQEPAGDAATRVAVLESAVEITPGAAPGRPLVVGAGQQLRFTATGPGPLEAADRHVADWSRGVLFADRMRLADFAAELGRYRPGLLRCDPAVAGLRITGAFQLDNTDRILAALPDTLPVQVVYRTRYWVSIAAPVAGA